MKTIIFDLSEVLIAGLIGIEHSLARRYATSPRAVLDAFGGERLLQLLHGTLSEDEYLSAVIEENGWDTSAGELKAIIRANLDRRVEGMEELIDELAGRYPLVLLSDHGTEWVSYIRQVHPILEKFDRQFFSCELGCTKRDPAAFETVIREVGGEAGDYLFIDDSPGNVAVARDVGMTAIRFTGERALRAELHRLGLLGQERHQSGRLVE